MATLDHAKTWSDILQNVATIVALIVGAIWTYRLYVKERTRYPRVQIAHTAKALALNRRFTLLTVTVTIKNIGSVLLTIDRALGNVYDVGAKGANLAGDVDESLSKDIRDPDGLRIKFPRIKTLERRWKKGEFELEPQEQDQVVFDFVLPVSVSAVRIYTYFNNPLKPSRNIGWSDSSVYSIQRLKQGVVY
jgi:hypothetical protein